MGADQDPNNLLFTPTWVIASVCTIFVLCSLIVERSIFFTGQALKKHKQSALAEALEKIKEELMLVGFISLALTVGKRSVLKICVPTKWSETMLQCSKSNPKHSTNVDYDVGVINREEGDFQGDPFPCGEGRSPFILAEGLHQLHLLLFTLAVVHVVYSVMTIALGMWKVNQWKAWEERAKEAASLTANGQLRLTRDVTFVRRHATGIWSTNPCLAYVAAFFQQFCQSVSETDYLTLRHGFVKKHVLDNFNFYQYILSSLEEDFKYVVGISPALWAYTVVLTLLNVDGWGMYFWASFIPMILVLAVGTKLRYIITRMAVQLFDKHAVIEGMPDVHPADELFWFQSPRLILYILHFILFQDALELSLHLWSSWTFPRAPCLYRHRYLLVGRLILGVLAQLTCGYVMLPLYALVSQMGSQMKNPNLEQHTRLASLKMQDLGSKEAALYNREGSIDLEQHRREGWTQQSSENLNKSTTYVLHGNSHKIANDGEAQRACSADENRDVDDNREERTGPVQDKGITLHRKMSYVQRVARGVQGIDYHTLSPPDL